MPVLTPRPPEPWKPDARPFAGLQGQDCLQSEPQRSPLVLVVEDEPELRNLIALGLEGAGFAVAMAANGATGFSLWNNLLDDVGLLLVDFHLGWGMTGVDLAKAIHAMRPQIPILMMSGYVPEAFHSSFPQLGDFSILLKPFSIESLKNMVMKRLSSAIQPVSSS